MQRATIVRYDVMPGREAENIALSRAVFDELRRNPPKDVAYALLNDGVQFLHVFLNLREDDAAPVVELESFRRFSESLSERVQAPPEQRRYVMRLIDSFGLAPALQEA